MAKSNQRDIKWGDGYVTERILKSGVTVYQARWKEPHPTRGIIWRSKNFGDEELASDHLREIGRKKRRGTYAPESMITLSEAIDEFADSRRDLGRWTNNTYITNRVFKQKLIDPQIGSIRVTRLTAQSLQRWADDLSTEKSTSTIRSTLSIIRGALKRQIQMGVIQSNPAQYIEVRSRQFEEAAPWSLEEVRAILKQTQTDPLIHALYLVGFNTGMRPGEIRALRWSDIDWDRQLITCQRTITKDENGREIVGETTKTGKPRVILVGQQIVDALRKQKSAQNERRLMHTNWRDTIIFDRGDGRFIPGSTFVKKHNAIIKASGVHPESPHNMRHTYATMEDEYGTSIGVSQARLGHASSAMTLRYTHAQISAQKGVADHMAGIITAEMPLESSDSG